MRKLLLVLFLIITGCMSYEKSNSKTEKITIADKDSIIRVINLDKDNRLELIENKYENSITVQTIWHDYLIEKAGVGNLKFYKDENRKPVIDTLHFSERKEYHDDETYLITAISEISTYGAESYFIVSQTGSGWIVSHLPFDRARFYDVDKDGFDEIIRYIQGDSLIYTYDYSGLILPDK